MDEESAARHTCKTLLEAWSDRKLRSSFRASTSSLLDWLFNYAPNPFESLFDLVERFADKCSDDAAEAIKLILEHFQVWLATHKSADLSVEQFTSRQVTRTSEVCRALKIFGRYYPELITCLNDVKIDSHNESCLSDAVYSVFSKFLSDKCHSEALHTFRKLGKIYRPLVAERHLSHLVRYLLSSQQFAEIRLMIEHCSESQRSIIFRYLDSYLKLPAHSFEREVVCCANMECRVTRNQFEDFVGELLNELKLPSQMFPSFLLRSKIKKFRSIMEKAITCREPEMDLTTFCEIVAEMAENDFQFQEHVIQAVETLGHSELGRYFSTYIFSQRDEKYSADDHRSAKRSRSSNSSSSCRPPPPSVIPTLGHKRPGSGSKASRKTYNLPLTSSSITFVDTLALLETAYEKLISSPLIALRVFTNAKMCSFMDKRSNTVSLLVVANFSQVYVIDLVRLPALERDSRSKFLLWLRTLLESNKLIRLVFRPIEDLRFLQRGIFPKESVGQFTMSSLRDLATFVDPKRSRRNRLGQVVNRWLGLHFPKEFRFSNWLRRPLTSDQMRYAASECYAMLEVYQKMAHYCSESGVDFSSLCRLTSRVQRQKDDDDSTFESNSNESDSDDEGNDDLFPPVSVAPRSDSALSSTSFSMNQSFLFGPSTSSQPSHIPSNPYMSAFDPQHSQYCNVNATNMNIMASDKSITFSANPYSSNTIPSIELESAQDIVAIDNYSDFERTANVAVNNAVTLVSVKRKISNLPSDIPVSYKSGYIYFLVADEFAELALQFIRMGFATQLCSPDDCSSAFHFIRSSQAAGFNIRRVAVGRRGLIEDVIRNYRKPSHSFSYTYEGVIVDTHDFRQVREKVSSILEELQLSPKDIKSHLSRAYSSDTEEPFVIYHPRAIFNKPLISLLRKHVSICPVPKGNRLTDEQIATISGLNIPETNRILMTNFSTSERLKRRYGEALRLLTVPRTDGSKKEMAELCEFIIGEVQALSKSTKTMTKESSDVSAPLQPVKVKTKSPLSKFSLMIVNDSHISQLVEYLELLGFSLSSVPAAKVSFDRAMAISKAGKKLLLASENYISQEQLLCDEFVCFRENVLATIYEIAEKFECVSVVDAELNNLSSRFIDTQKQNLGKLVVFDNSLRPCFDLLSQLGSLVEPVFYDSSANNLNMVLDMVAKEKSLLVADLKTTFSCTKLAGNTDAVPFIAVPPGPAVDQVKYIFQLMGKRLDSLVPENLRESIKSIRFVIQAPDAEELALYLKLIGCAHVDTVKTPLPIVKLCELAETSDALYLAKMTEADLLYLKSQKRESRNIILLNFPATLDELLPIIFKQMSNCFIESVSNDAGTCEECDVCTSSSCSLNKNDIPLSCDEVSNDSTLSLN